MRLFFTTIICLLFGAQLLATPGRMTEYQKGIIYNMQGPKASAWNLYGNSEKWLHENDFEKDLINTTKITDRLPFFRRELKGGNGTTFVKAKNFHWEDANYASVKKYFSKHKSTKVIKNITAGDVYILKLKNTDDYAVIRISKIKDDGTSLAYSGNNMDYIAFDYTVFKVTVSEAVTFLDENFEEEEQPYWDPEAEMLIYPNPVVDKIHVKFRKATDNIGWVVRLENMNGEKIYTSEHIYETHWINDFKELSEGRYILSVLKNDQVYLQKVIDKDKKAEGKLTEVYQ
ncbi:MAG TPA: T9SS type A sorting domain-containing protein [Cytophagaceae bacterium]|nr:T9SS type A sorting domain-containing protein [Cytophagaceae bacterium]